MAEFNWKKVEDFADVITGGTPSRRVKEYWDDGTIPWLNSGELNQDIITYTRNYITEKGLKNSSARLMPADSVLIALTGSTTGKSAYLTFEACANQSVTGILPSVNHDSQYLYQFFKTQKEAIFRKAWGGAQPHISQKFVKEYKVPLPSLDEQKRIAKVLSDCEALIAKRKESIALLDELLKSTFLEMFGDPVRNEKGWDLKTIEEFSKKEKHSIKRGPFGGALKKEIFVNDGYLVYEQYHALNNDFTFARYYIDEKKYKELEAFSIKPGDIIISCSGVNLGRLAIIPDNSKKGIINQALLKVTLNQKLMSNIMFVHIFTNPHFKQKFFGNVRGSGVPNFPPMSSFKRFKFICPPKELQNKFVGIVDKIENIKHLYQTHLQELENLYGSLSQKAFKGELDVSKVDIFNYPDKSQSTNYTTTVKETQDNHTSKLDSLNVEMILDKIIKNDIKKELFGLNEIEEILRLKKININNSLIKDFLRKSMSDNSIEQKYSGETRSVLFKIKK
ncbi:restriction endonuclease subunit S [uncultured Psychroserpens sp.]|uniref:restriction endonuclease subunit S n=1 Tax=uncultured Psychroserpens sp. TaxID=255436 RepID=UPI00261B7B94|nr:restriction endonuclease subunit S [uncultured Psychroserpens sp.]